ncbi:unnamed protein product [Ilex paraguariensis]|uniref:Uncharacterized protein n=1 Tax=Ilex paraguariensis TaxID=185542 RepID=A0ABC8U9I3_9AQUA
MGSTSAVIYNLQLNNTHCFKSLNSNTNHRTSLHIQQGRPKLGVSYRRDFKKFSRVVCFAVEDVTEKQQQLGGGGISGVGSALEDRPGVVDGVSEDTFQNDDPENGGSALYNILYPNKELLPDDKEMSIFDHLEELRQRLFVSVLAVGAAILGCFAYSKELIMILEAPVRTQGVRFLQLAPGEFFFTTLKVRINSVFCLQYYTSAHRDHTFLL